MDVVDDYVAYTSAQIFSRVVLFHSPISLRFVVWITRAE